MKPVVFDLDDLCDEFDPWFELQGLKEMWPGLKVTLFAIPSRCSTGLLEKYGELDWVELGVHGYHHSSRECGVWNTDEAQSKLDEVEEFWPGAKVFKAPGWKKNVDVDDVLHERGWIIADHIVEAPDWSALEALRYVYNAQDQYTAIHGHTWETSGNGPGDWLEMFGDVDEDAEFLFISEVAAPFESFDDTQDDASSWSHRSPWGKHAAHNLISLAQSESITDGSIVDFGGNDGYAAAVAKQMGLDAINIEPEPKRCWFSRTVHGVETIMADITDVPLEDGSVDWGFCSHVMEHVEDFDKVLGEIRRVCRLGCLFVVPVESQEEFDGNPAHVRRHTHEEWAELLGAEPVDLRSNEFTGVWKR